MSLGTNPRTNFSGLQHWWVDAHHTGTDGAGRWILFRGKFVVLAVLYKVSGRAARRIRVNFRVNCQLSSFRINSHRTCPDIEVTVLVCDANMLSGWRMPQDIRKILMQTPLLFGTHWSGPCNLTSLTQGLAKSEFWLRKSRLHSDCHDIISQVRLSVGRTKDFELKWPTWNASELIPIRTRWRSLAWIKWKRTTWLFQWNQTCLNYRLLTGRGAS
jgi:hypothetical protein